VRSAPNLLQQLCLQYTAVHSKPLQSWMVLCCGDSAHSFKEMLQCPGNNRDRALCFCSPPTTLLTVQCSTVHSKSLQFWMVLCCGDWHTLPMRRCGVLATSAIVRSAPKPLQQFCLQYCTVHSRPLQPWMVLCCGKSAHSFEQVLRTAVSWQQVRAELLS
jgi:hypothetical protein